MNGLEPGDIFGGYRIDGLIGRGGMGMVYQATQLSLGRTVALKVLTAELGEDPEFRERFRREGHIQGAVDHPNIVPVYEAGEIDGHLFLAMRYVPGSTLMDLITRGELDVPRTLRILGPLADALDAAHEAGLVHRDIKPHNVLIGPRDHAYLADFGLTRAAGVTRLTKTGQFVGTIDYISPEQIQGRDITAASDIYSLGAVLFECLTGSVPFPSKTEAAGLYAHMLQEPPPPSQRRPGLPVEVDAVLARALAKDPAQRYSSAAALVEAAHAALGPAAAAGPPSAGEPPSESPTHPVAPPLAPSEGGTSPTIGRPVPPQGPTSMGS